MADALGCGTGNNRATDLAVCKYSAGTVQILMLQNAKSYTSQAMLCQIVLEGSA
jgi:hypothetical protein